jgi:hypothetical protein
LQQRVRYLERHERTKIYVYGENWNDHVLELVLPWYETKKKKQKKERKHRSNTQ